MNVQAVYICILYMPVTCKYDVCRYVIHKVTNSTASSNNYQVRADPSPYFKKEVAGHLSDFQTNEVFILTVFLHHNPSWWSKRQHDADQEERKGKGATRIRPNGAVGK